MRHTQISGDFSTHSSAYSELQQQLNTLSIYCSPFYDTPIAALDAEQHYSAQVAFYGSIAQSSFHIVYCGRPLDMRASNELLYAFLKSKPVIILGMPVFEKAIGYYAKLILKAKLKQSFSAGEVNQALLAKIPRNVDYQLSLHQQILIRSRIKSHLHELFMQTKR